MTLDKSLKTIGQRIAQARKSRGLSQQQLADAINVTRGLVSLWEIGSSAIQSEQVSAIAKLFNTSSDWLMDGIGLPPQLISRRTTSSISKEFFDVVIREAFRTGNYWRIEIDEKLGKINVLNRPTTVAGSSLVSDK